MHRSINKTSTKLNPSQCQPMDTTNSNRPATTTAYTIDQLTSAFAQQCSITEKTPLYFQGMLLAPVEDIEVKPAYEVKMTGSYRLPLTNNTANNRSFTTYCQMARK